jgi:hypothetical protein
MWYDLDLVHQLCGEIGLRSSMSSPDELAIELADGVRLTFKNLEREEDCLVGFNGTPWHTHGDFSFYDGRGHYVEMEYRDVIAGLADGRVLICERSVSGVIANRWLIHRDYIDEFKYMEPGEQISVWRPRVALLTRVPTPP